LENVYRIKDAEGKPVTYSSPLSVKRSAKNIGRWFKISGLSNVGASSIESQSEMKKTVARFGKGSNMEEYLYPLEKVFWDATLPKLELNDFDEYNMVNEKKGATLIMGDSEILMECPPPTEVEVELAEKNKKSYENIRLKEANIKYLIGEIFSILDDDASGTLDDIEAKFAAEHITDVITGGGNIGNRGEAVELQKQFKDLGNNATVMTRKRFIQMMYEKTGMGKTVILTEKFSQESENKKRMHEYRAILKGLRKVVETARGKKHARKGIVAMILRGLLLPFYMLRQAIADPNTSPFKSIWGFDICDTCYRRLPIENSSTYEQLGSKDIKFQFSRMCSSSSKILIWLLAVVLWAIYSALYYSALLAPIAYNESVDLDKEKFSPLEGYIPLALCVIVAVFGQIVFVTDWKYHLKESRYKNTDFSPMFDGDTSAWNIDKRSANDLISELNKVGRKKTKIPTLFDVLTEKNIMKGLNFVMIIAGLLFIFVCIWAFSPVIYFLPPALSKISVSVVFDLVGYGAFTILLGLYGSCFLWRSKRKISMINDDASNHNYEKTLSGRIEKCLRKRNARLAAIFTYIVFMTINIVVQLAAGGMVTIYAVDIAQSVDKLALESAIYEKEKYISLNNISAEASVFGSEDPSLTYINEFFLCAQDECCNMYNLTNDNVTSFYADNSNFTNQLCPAIGFMSEKCSHLTANVLNEKSCSTIDNFIHNLLTYVSNRLMPIGILILIMGAVEFILLASVTFTLFEKNICSRKRKYSHMDDNDGETGSNDVAIHIEEDDDEFDGSVSESKEEQMKQKRRRMKFWVKCLALFLAVLHACVPGFYRSTSGYYFFGNNDEEGNLVLLHTTGSLFFLYQIYGRLGDLLVEWYSFANSLSRFSILFDAIETRKIRLYDGRFTRLNPEIFDNVKVWESIRNYYLECRLPHASGDGLPVLGPVLLLNMGLISFLFFRVIIGNRRDIDASACMIAVDVISFSLYLVSLMGIAVTLNSEFDGHSSTLSQLSLEILEKRAEIAEENVGEKVNHEKASKLEALLATNMYLTQMRKYIDDNSSPVRIFGVPIDKNLRNAVIGYIATTAAAPASIFLLEMIQNIGHGNSHHGE
jgi:hypothetical protein